MYAAVITFDRDRVEKTKLAKPGDSLAWIVWWGLCGRT